MRNEALDIQLKVFSEHKEEDMIEFSHRLDDIRSEFEYPFLKKMEICYQLNQRSPAYRLRPATGP